jgi:hypothetical protein
MDDLERDITVQTAVVGAIHLAHSAATQQLEDLVRAESYAGRYLHRVRP